VTPGEIEKAGRLLMDLKILLEPLYIDEEDGTVVPPGNLEAETWEAMVQAGVEHLAKRLREDYGVIIETTKVPE